MADETVVRFYFKIVDGVTVITTDPSEAEYYLEQPLILTDLIPV